MNNQNHPSNGWFARGLKAQYYRPAAKAAGFCFAKNPIKFPSAAVRDDSLDLSFSGIKTAVLNYINQEKQKGNELPRADIAAGFVEAAVSSVVIKLGKAFDRNPEMKTLVLAGGVAANSHLRAALEKMCKKRGIQLCMPERALCGDNAAMIAAAGYFEYCGHA